MPTTTVLDACVLIAHLDSADAHHDASERVLEESAAGDLAASALTLAEVFVEPARRGLLETACAGLSEIGLTEIPVHCSSGPDLARLRAESGLKLPDCCVLLAAQTGGSSIATFDESLAAVARKRGIEVADTPCQDPGR